MNKSHHVAGCPACQVRRATSADGDQVLACLAEAFEPYRTQYTPLAFLDTVLTPKTLSERMQSMTVLVAEEPSGGIIGTVACGIVDASEGHLRGMAVRSRWQGAGIAQLLLEHAESELRAQGCKRMTLDTTIPLERAMRFYERNGFVRSGRISDFFGMRLIEYVKVVLCEP